MKKTVLEYVQTTLSVMDSDEVDTISETVESVQVAEQLKETYYELLNRQEWDFLRRAVGLVAAGNPDEPTRFDSPAGLKRLTSFKYNTSSDLSEYSGKEIKYLEPHLFLARNSLAGDNRQLITLEAERLQFYVATNKAPTYYTSFDDETIYCDAFDSAQGATLISARAISYGVVIPDFRVEDDFVPFLPQEMMPLLQASLNNASMIYFKQQPNAVDSVREGRQLAQARRQQNKFTKREYYNNRYGRR